MKLRVTPKKNIYVIAHLTKPELSMLKVVDFYKLKERESKIK
jgi:hypothetical protein